MTMVNGGGCAIWLLAWEEGGDDYGFLVLEVEG